MEHTPHEKVARVYLVCKSPGSTLSLALVCVFACNNFGRVGRWGFSDITAGFSREVVWSRAAAMGGMHK